MSGPRIGSLCSGYGGLDMGVQSVLGGTVAWHVEYDRDPSKILAHHWPDVPNHGDVKLTDWAAVEPVDVLTAGYPCQPFSHAGKRKGADDPRHLWPDVARAVGVLRPGLVVLENVRGHVSLGLADVLADLSALGYDATWGVVRAADAGAPHGRARIFILATPDAADDGREQGHPRRPSAQLSGAPRPGDAASDAGSGPFARTAAARDGLSVVVERRHLAPADAQGERWGEGRPESARVVGGSDAAVRGGAAAPDADRGGRDGRTERHGEAPGELAAPRRDDAAGRVLDSWGAYGPAVARWERALGRPAPRPTEPGRNGPRLSPAFVEWLMGLPAGHVTDVPDLSRNAQLKALGNGVVPQQAALAIRTLLNVRSAAA